MSTVHTITLTTPDGPLTIISDATSVLASGWTDDVVALSRLIHPSLRPDPGHLQTGKEQRGGTVLSQAADAVTAYYDGEHGSVAQVPVIQRSGPFREHAWDVLRQVAPGEPITYAEYARRAQNAAAVRAVASACATNAAALFVPCHRIIRSDGTLGGFRYGLTIKQSLLARETRP